MASLWGFFPPVSFVFCMMQPCSLSWQFRKRDIVFVPIFYWTCDMLEVDLASVPSDHHFFHSPRSRCELISTSGFYWGSPPPRPQSNNNRHERAMCWPISLLWCRRRWSLKLRRCFLSLQIYVGKSSYHRRSSLLAEQLNKSTFSRGVWPIYLMPLTLQNNNRKSLAASNKHIDLLEKATCPWYSHSGHNLIVLHCSR